MLKSAGRASNCSAPGAAQLTITSTATTIRNDWVSFPDTFKNPTIRPRITRSDVSHTAAAPKNPEATPNTTAIITPIIKE